MRVELMGSPCSVTSSTDLDVVAVGGAAGAQLRRVAGAAGAEVEVLADDDDPGLQRAGQEVRRRTAAGVSAASCSSNGSMMSSSGPELAR